MHKPKAEPSAHTVYTPNARKRQALLVGLCVAVLGLAGCSGVSDATKQDLTNALQLEDSFDNAEATCIATAVFDEYGGDQDQLNKIAYSPSVEEIETGDDAITGFGDFFDDSVATCVP